MEIRYIVGIAVATAIATTLALVPLWVWGKVKPPEIQVVTIEVPQPKLSTAQIVWLARLMLCESGGKANAINPKDVDNTPSYGLMQFKPGTFNAYIKKYGITGELMDGVSQVAIVEQWLLHTGEVRWTQQFPSCVAKLGMPPNTDNHP